MIEIKTEALTRPLKGDSNLTPLYYELQNACDYVGNYIDDLVNDIYDGKKNAVKDYFAKSDKAYKVVKLAKIDPELVQRYETFRKGYDELEKVVQSILNCVKIGESQDTAIKKLAKMTETVKYFSLEKMKYNGKYFDPMSEEDILDEINDFLPLIINLSVCFSQVSFNC